MHLLATAIGLAVTIGIKTIVVKLLRGSYYSAFYRKRPAASSIMGVVLECWCLAQSAGTVTTRFAKLMLFTGMNVGRIDMPILAPGAGSKVDSAPEAFKMDLLSHEAVRTHRPLRHDEYHDKRNSHLDLSARPAPTSVD